MDNEWPALMARLEIDRMKAESLVRRLEALRGQQLAWLWLHRGFMLLDVVLICWNVTTIAQQVNVYATWLSGGVTALLCWSFCNSWKFSESRWREYQSDLQGVKETLQWLNNAMQQAKGMHAHQD